MDIHGSRMMSAPRAAVFAAILDPSTLMAVIPGCKALEQTGDGEYRGRIALRLPGVVGTYRTVVRVVDVDPPGYGRLEGEVAGALGTIRGKASFRLAEAGTGTSVDYDGSGIIDGPLARLDNRFVEGMARTLVDQGLGSLDARLQAEASAGAATDRDQATEVPA
jgi:carbon monoxide dehydrogenase subunit G